jgi:hypothetical protein
LLVLLNDCLTATFVLELLANLKGFNPSSVLTAIDQPLELLMSRNLLIMLLLFYKFYQPQPSSLPVF